MEEKIKTTIKDAYSFEIAQMHIDKILIFLVDSNKEALKISHNLKFFTTRQVIIYPEWDCDYYDKISASQQVSCARIDGLHKILHAKSDAIIVTTLKAILPLTIPVDYFLHNALFLKPSIKVDYTNLSSSLINIGYTKVDNTRNYGEYAIRGDIVDVANIDNAHGHRLDIFGTEIECIKEFSLSSQISDQEFVNQITILPASEVVINNNTLEVFKKKTSNNINAFYESVIHGFRPLNILHYSVLFYEKPSSFFEYIKHRYTMVYSNEEYVSKNLIKDQIDISYQKMLKNEYQKYYFENSEDRFDLSCLK